MNKHTSPQEYFKKVMENQKNRKYCAKHLTGYVGINPETHKEYVRCNVGHRLMEDCQITDE